jgi:glycosyltransferase involved in cell wall biosynthesis
MITSPTHLVLLPTYNTGPRLLEVVRGVLHRWHPVLVVVDGSTDRSEGPVLELAATEPALTVLVLPANAGKGAAVLAGARDAAARGYTHALVMDADGQHPAESIAEFMAVSQAQPEALVLGRPIFPANIPVERRQGRKLSVGLVRFEVLGPGIADPLFGFRVYPLDPLLAVLGPVRGGRRYDFDTEAAVRLSWAGVPPVNRAAPVKYFSRAEGGVSHFRYGRDNATLVWMHIRLITELLLWRWPTVRRQRRRWNLAGATGAVLLICATLLTAAEPDPLVAAAHRLAPGAPEWTDLVAVFAHKGDTMTEFTERRFFPFKKAPVELRGEVRFSSERGLSLHYLAPEERTVILDAQGLLIRAGADEKAAPADPRARAASEALLHILGFEVGALDRDFEIYGRRAGAGWSLALVPRTDQLRRGVGVITVAGEGAVVRSIELRHSARQYIEIVNAPPRPAAAFTADEARRYFR